MKAYSLIKTAIDKDTKESLKNVGLPAVSSVIDTSVSDVLPFGARNAVGLAYGLHEGQPLAGLIGGASGVNGAKSKNDNKSRLAETLAGSAIGGLISAKLYHGKLSKHLTKYYKDALNSPDNIKKAHIEHLKALEKIENATGVRYHKPSLEEFEKALIEEKDDAKNSGPNYLLGAAGGMLAGGLGYGTGRLLSKNNPKAQENQ